jgi:HAD superfamily hydrolase (TIGR01549 family)
LSANIIKAIFYDLDGTLHTDNPLQLEVFCKGATKLGLEISAESRLQTARWEYYYFSQSKELLADRIAHPDEKAFWDNYIRRQLMALGASSQQVEEFGPQLYQYMYENYHPEDIILPDVHDVLKTLKERGYILGLVTNRNQLHNDHPKEFGLREYFNFWLSADQINSWKPDKRIFEHALQLAGVDAGQTIYVGDNYFTDVIGSRNAGMKPVLFDVNDVFDQPDCTVIRSHSQILDLL